jgi:predicted nucleic acid-binding protein
VIILDTNVVSEMIAAQVAEPVRAWVIAQDPDQLWLTAFTVSEMLYGIHRLDAGRRREQIETAVIKVLFDDYGGRILPFDAEAALRHGQLRAQLRRDGRPTQDSDALIAAIALSHSATIATRNIKHFEHCGVELIDPWSS